MIMTWYRVSYPGGSHAITLQSVRRTNRRVHFQVLGPLIFHQDMLMRNIFTVLNKETIFYMTQHGIQKKNFIFGKHGQPFFAKKTKIFHFDNLNFNGKFLSLFKSLRIGLKKK